MAWSEERSRRRVKIRDFHDFEVDVQDLSRTMDFRNLGKKDVRRVEGVHLYIDIPGFHAAVSEAGNDQEKQKKLIRAASVLRKVQRDLMDADDIGDIQRQTVRLHALSYKPYDREEGSRAAERARRAVTHAITQNTYIIDVFDLVFDKVSFGGAAGLSGGKSYIANIGMTGERELISLGSCANLAAKILGGTDTITVTQEVYDHLPDNLRVHFKKSAVVGGIQSYQATGLRWSRFPDLADDLEVDWDEGMWLEKTKKYRDDLPLDQIEVSDATALIDLEILTERNCKRTAAVAIYADLDGFTRYVQEAETNEKVVSLIRQFHMIRAEFHSVISSDYEGLVLQHRGDCILAILHMPCGDNHSERCSKAVDIAIALQSSMEHVLNEHLKDRKGIHLAVGLDVGKVLVTRLGKKGHRIGISFGPELSSAERLQMRTGARQISISEEVFDQVDDEEVLAKFAKDRDGYVATGLTLPELDRLREEKAVRAGSFGAAIKDGNVVVTTAASPMTGTWHNSRPWRSH